MTFILCLAGHWRNGIDVERYYDPFGKKGKRRSKHTAEYFLSFLPFFVYSLVLVTYPVAYIFDEDNPIVLISCVPTESRNLLTYSFCFCVDLLMFLLCLAAAHFAIYMVFDI